MDEIRYKAIVFHNEHYDDAANNDYAAGFCDGYRQAAAENERKIIERIKELDSKGYCQDKNEPCPYMDDSERGCATCIAEKVAEEMNL